MTPLTEWPDRELVSALLLHDEDACTELFRRYADSVGAAARMVLGNSSVCDDIVAEVFLSLWLAPEAFDSTRGSLLGYLRLKARGKSVDLVRGDSARARRELAHSSSRLRHDKEFDADIMAAESAIEMFKAVAKLRPKEKVPIQLAFAHGMTYQSIAVSLGIPEGTVKARIRSALRHLREDMAAQRLTEDTVNAANLEADGAHF